MLHGIGEGGLNKPSYLNDDNYDKDDGDKYIDIDGNAKKMVRKSKLPAPAVRQKPAQDETSGHSKLISLVIFVAGVSRTNPLFWHCERWLFKLLLSLPSCACFDPSSMFVFSQ